MAIYEVFSKAEESAQKENFRMFKSNSDAVEYAETLSHMVWVYRVENSVAVYCTFENKDTGVCSEGFVS